MNVFDLPFKVAKEVVKRNRNDNRRLTTQRPDGGNNIFYLGITESFLEKLDNVQLVNRLRIVQALLDNDDRHPRAIQEGEGVPAIHKISKLKLQNLLNFLPAFLNEYVDMYHNPNLDSERITNALNNLDSEFLEFESDVLFIHDNNGSKPYFKWFNKKPTSYNWKLFQEFLIPELSFLNFDFQGYEDGVMRFEWDLNYAHTVIMSSDNIEEIVINSVQHIIPNIEERETIKEAITKIRIGQSQFRRNLIQSNRNTCIFTELSDPQLLIASHIKAWKDSNNNERVNINNGLLLSPTFDKLFDRYLITFNEDGSIRWSANRLNAETIEILSNGITVEGEILINITDDNRDFIVHHRNKFLELENL
jgi:hypothetical protein